MITAKKKLNRGKTIAVGTYNHRKKTWTVELQGECHRPNRATIEQGFAQLLNECTAEVPRQRNARKTAKLACQKIPGWEIEA